jgi:hypothetical protein
MGSVYRLTLRQLSGRWRLSIMTVLAALPVIIAFAMLSSADAPSVIEFETAILSAMLTGSIAPLVVLAIAAAAFGNEVEDRTLANLTLSPIPRWQIALPKLLATITIATMIYMIEIKNVKGGLARFFDVFGKNALFVFALSAFLPKGLSLIRIPNGLNAKGEINFINPWNWLYQKVLVNIPGDPKLGSLLYALCVITFMWAICYWMDKKKIYIKV